MARQRASRAVCGAVRDRGASAGKRRRPGQRAQSHGRAPAPRALRQPRGHGGSRARRRRARPGRGDAGVRRHRPRSRLGRRAPRAVCEPGGHCRARRGNRGAEPRSGRRAERRERVDGAARALLQPGRHPGPRAVRRRPLSRRGGERPEMVRAEISAARPLPELGRHAGARARRRRALPRGGRRRRAPSLRRARAPRHGAAGRALPGLLLAELGLDAGRRWACTEALVALHPDAAANAAVSPPPSEVPDLLEF